MLVIADRRHDSDPQSGDPRGDADKTQSGPKNPVKQKMRVRGTVVVPGEGHHVPLPLGGLTRVT
jgi:hypothetical protein